MKLRKIFFSPEVNNALRSSTVIFRPGVYPRILEWTTYPITTLLERVWTLRVKPKLINPAAEGRPDPVYVELISTAERCLNFAHTGAAKVLNRNLMWHMWVTRCRGD